MWVIQRSYCIFHMRTVSVPYARQYDFLGHANYWKFCHNDRTKRVFSDYVSPCDFVSCLWFWIVDYKFDMFLKPLELCERIDAFGQCANLVTNIHKTGIGMACKKNRNMKRLERRSVADGKFRFNFFL